MKKLIILVCISIGIFGFAGCKKFLDEERNKEVSVIKSLKDLQLLLDNYTVMNSEFPAASEIMSDNYTVPDGFFGFFPEIERNLYKWTADNNTINFWYQPYKAILTCNVVLEALPDLEAKPSETNLQNNVRSSAYFFRGYNFYALSQLFAGPYDSSNADEQPGIPLRLNSEIKEQSVRSTLRQTYNQMVADLKEAAKFLPDAPLIKTRPSKPAAYGALAKVYLAMQKYDSAAYYANECLKIYEQLIDFNTLDSTAPSPFSRFNEEVIFHMRSNNPTILLPFVLKMNADLMSEYSDNDLRKPVYYTDNGDGTYSFKGDLDAASFNSGFVFGGIVTDEMYLIRAEGRARADDVPGAMDDLNALLQTRHRNNVPYQPVTAANRDEAIEIILNERRKELVFRGTRWTDIRRLSKEPQFAIVPERTVNGETYVLQLNSPRYLLRIPEVVVTQSGIPQNP